jgi:glucokinase
MRSIAAALADGPACAAIGVSVGARVRADGGGVAEAPNLRGYEGRALRDDLARVAGVPVRLAHDTVCGLLAEWRAGALRGCDRCAYLTVSTGTGAAVLLRDRLVSIEFGHQILAGNDRACLCGQVGCLETYTGGRQIELRAGRPPEAIGDPAFWDEVAAKLALGLVNLAHLTRVEVVAVGGGIALHRGDLLDRVGAHLAARLRNLPLALVPAALGADAPLIGATLLPGTDAAMIVQ